MVKKKNELGRKASRAAVSPEKIGTQTASRFSVSNLPLWKKALFSLLPALLLLIGAETAVRIAGIAEPRLQTLPLPEETAGLFISDPDLFWSLRPNLTVIYEGAPVTTNRQGLRSPNVRTKKDNEVRILSLGESSTFGVGVSNAETYTALLPELLQDQDPSRIFTAFNAGVPAWSSFQSLKYLELRGLRLHPDVVLFYHELNDYLPSTLRDSSNNEIGAQKTDREMYESRHQFSILSLLNTSALFRFLQLHYAYWSIKAFNRDDFSNPLLTIGLPDISLYGRLGQLHNNQWHRMQLNEKSLGRRVSDKERLQNLSELVRLCKTNDIALVIIHPSYRYSIRHQCLLTDFCLKEGVLMYDAYDALHPPGLPDDTLYRDFWHPNRVGHRQLAEGLAKFLKENLFVQGIKPNK
jgi:hypothetical protein